MYILGKAKISLLENNIEKYENSLKGVADIATVRGPVNFLISHII